MSSSIRPRGGGLSSLVAEVNRKNANFVPEFFNPFLAFDSCPEMNSTRKIMLTLQLTFILEANYYLNAHNAHFNFASSAGEVTRLINYVLTVNTKVSKTCYHYLWTRIHSNS